MNKIIYRSIARSYLRAASANPNLPPAKEHFKAMAEVSDNEDLKLFYSKVADTVDKLHAEDSQNLYYVTGLAHVRLDVEITILLRADSPEGAKEVFLDNLRTKELLQDDCHFNMSTMEVLTPEENYLLCHTDTCLPDDVDLADFQNPVNLTVQVYE